MDFLVRILGRTAATVTYSVNGGEPVTIRIGWAA